MGYGESKQKNLTFSQFMCRVSQAHSFVIMDYVGGISKCSDRRARTLLCEVANVMLTNVAGRTTRA
jgi:hypothetical protein